MSSAQLCGYLYEIFIKRLLECNGFKTLTHEDFPKIIINRRGELAGRGSNHQIDYTGIYTQSLPFIFPLRILVECKFWKTEVSKVFIREYIGVFKDISENYFSNNSNGEFRNNVRFVDVPIIFSANGFDLHAEQLAFAHGINLVSHKVKYLDDIKAKIINVASLIKSANLTKDKLDECYYAVISCHTENMANSAIRAAIDLLNNQINSTIHDMTFLLATTENGHIINIISKDEFPTELFNNSDTEHNCTISYDDVDSGEFFIQFLHHGYRDRKFYFNASRKMLDKKFRTVLSRDERISEKQEYFTKLTIYMNINNISRCIVLKPNYDEIIPVI